MLVISSFHSIRLETQAFQKQAAARRLPVGVAFDHKIAFLGQSWFSRSVLAPAAQCTRADRLAEHLLGLCCPGRLSDAPDRSQNLEAKSTKPVFPIYGSWMLTTKCLRVDFKTWISMNSDRWALKKKGTRHLYPCGLIRRARWRGVFVSITRFECNEPGKLHVELRRAAADRADKRDGLARWRSRYLEQQARASRHVYYGSIPKSHR